MPDSFIPARTVVQHGDRTRALDYLHARHSLLSLDTAYHDDHDPRHDAAVLAVDVASRLVWLHQQISEAASTARDELSKVALLSSRRHIDEPVRHDGITVSPVIERLPSLVARAEELEHTLSMIASMFRAVWHNDPSHALAQD